MSSYILVFLGAGVGGALRHGVNLAALRLLGLGFPHGTLTVNILGSFALGLLTGWFALKAAPGQSWRLFLTTGMLSGFMTSPPSRSMPPCCGPRRARAVSCQLWRSFRPASRR
jgi:CrcB protein